MVGILSLLLLTGCPYGSEVPLDKPFVRIDKRLLGEWVNTADKEYLYRVSPGDEYTYTILKIKVNGHGHKDDTLTYNAYLTNLDSILFFTVYAPDTVKKSYLFYKYEMAPDGRKVALTPVTDNIDEKFDSSKDLRAFFQKYMHLSFFFDKDAEVYIKKE
ncbi:MAG: hypothetical protein KatS3mg031_0915 [Chitinophagales bacterium]|nr:MAG: hypothetical protein KatS3mg031_0915 [Chitinophagales bacterium]